jgi:hypothetical protein
LCTPFILAHAQDEPNRIYVRADAQGSGTSWQSPTWDLQKALHEACPGTEIWVASGTYFPTENNDRTQAFVVPEGVKLYGGFSGYEGSPAERDLANNVSILSGEIGETNREDNSYTVLYTAGLSKNTVIDGFIITGGNANMQVKERNPFSSGGGWYNEASGGSTSSPVVRNCIFQNNFAFFGAGFYNNAEGGRSDLIIEDCSFIGNVAQFDGGAILNNGSHGVGNITILYTTFEMNEAYYGAGILNKAEIAGEASPYLKHVRFQKNLAYMKGSPIYNLRSAQGSTSPIMESCISIDNQESVRTPESTTIQVDTDKKKQVKRSITISSTY